MSGCILFLVCYLLLGLICWICQWAFLKNHGHNAPKQQKLVEFFGPVVCTLIYFAFAPLCLPVIVWRIVEDKRNKEL